MSHFIICHPTNLPKYSKNKTKKKTVEDHCLKTLQNRGHWGKCPAPLLKVGRGDKTMFVKYFSYNFISSAYINKNNLRLRILAVLFKNI